MRNRIGNVLWGIIFLGLGLGLLGDMAGLWEFTLLFKGNWTLFLIIPALIGIIRNGVRIGNTLCFLCGIALLCCCQGVMDWDTLSVLVVPVVFIVIGLVMLLKNLIHIGGRKVRIEGENMEKIGVIFSGRKILVENEFHGGEFEAVFGGVTLDLRKAGITDNISIDVLAVFGGVDILLPSNVRVKMNDTGLFGGCSNSYRNCEGEVPVVYINATALFGGVEVK